MDYIIKDKNYRFYYKRGDGLLMQKGSALPERLNPKSTENFCVYEQNGVIHIICVSEENELLYTILNENKRNDCVLCRLGEQFAVKKITAAPSGGRMNLIYSAEYNGENLLVYCVLGNNAKPSVIDKLKSGYFFVFASCVYYTNAAGIMGYQEFSDGKPDRFIRTEDGAEDVYLCERDGKSYVVFRKSNTIFVNYMPITDDVDVSHPILALRGTKLELMWKSGAIVKYTDLENPKHINRLISTGEQPLICIFEKDGIFYNYRSGETTFEPGEKERLLASVAEMKQKISLAEDRIRKLSE